MPTAGGGAAPACSPDPSPGWSGGGTGWWVFPCTGTWLGGMTGVGVIRLGTGGGGGG